MKRPLEIVDGMALKPYVPGEVYDISPTLADYLVLQGYAKPEMRSPAKCGKKKPSPDVTNYGRSWQEHCDLAICPAINATPRGSDNLHLTGAVIIETLHHCGIP